MRTLRSLGCKVLVVQTLLGRCGQWSVDRQAGIVFVHEDVSKRDLMSLYAREAMTCVVEWLLETIQISL
jgi:hypothetical protein